MNDRQTGRAHQRDQLSVEQFIAEAELTASPRIVADVETASSALISEDSDARQPAERIATVLGSEKIRSNKQSRLTDGLIVLGRCKIAGAQKKIVAPLASVMGNVHEGHARAAGHDGHPRAERLG